MKFKKILICIGIICGVIGLSAFIYVGCLIVKAPDIHEVDATPEGYLSTILDKDGNVTETLYIAESNRVYVELEHIPQNLIDAFVAIEDSRFYEHKGIDPRGIARAFVKGITKGEFSQGASTITQQLLKNNVFTDWMEEDSFKDRLDRKVQELYLAVRLEQNYPKEWILENYLNTINLGGGTRGVQVASKYYFGKEVSELTLAESALIAGITKSPTAYNPLLNPGKSISRQKLVLDAMLSQKMLTQEEYDAAMQEDVIGNLITDSSKRGNNVFSWFEDALLVQVVDDLMETYGYDEAEAWEMIYAGGLTIHSTQDVKLQKLCEAEAVKEGWYGENQQISIVMTDTETGAVVAVVGGSEEKKENLIYNRATDAIRQPGSTIKVIGEYAAALDNGKITLGTVIDDAPYTYSDGTNIKNSYESFKGKTTVRDAIASSGNIAALKMFQMVGEDKVFQYLNDFGITTLTEEDKNESLSIGGTHNGVTNLELTGAYNAIANDGNYIRPYFYTKVVDRQGDVILEQEETSKQVISGMTAELLTAAMEEVMNSGTGTAANVEGLTLAGKSGTTNEKKDIWFVGFSDKYTLGIWGGHDNHEPQGDSVYVKKMWQSIMKQSHIGVADGSLVNENNLVKVNICTKCGQRAVSGLCDVSVQGNMTRYEYFATGTEPEENCDCHVAVTICESNGHEAGSYCPEVETKVYLFEGTEGTEDAEYVVPASTDMKCEEHTNIFDKWFNEEEESHQEDSEQEEYQEDTGNGWDIFFPWNW